MEAPKLIWTYRGWGISGPLMPGSMVLPAGNPMSGWYVENDNPRPINIEDLRVTGRYRRFFGQPFERTWALNSIILRPGQEVQVQAPRRPWFASLLSHALEITASYDGNRFRLGNYRRSNLFEPNRSLVLWLDERTA